MNVFPCFTIFAGAFDARPSQPPGRASHAPAKMVQQGKPFTRPVNLKVDKLDFEISSGGINSYNFMAMDYKDLINCHAIIYNCMAMDYDVLIHCHAIIYDCMADNYGILIHPHTLS